MKQTECKYEALLIGEISGSVVNLWKSPGKEFKDQTSPLT